MNKSAQIIESISLSESQKEKLMMLLDSIPEKLADFLTDELSSVVGELDDNVKIHVNEFKVEILKSIAFYQGMIVASKDITDERKKELVAESLEWKKRIVEGIEKLLSERTNQ